MIDLLAAFLPALSPLPPTWRPSVYLSALLALLKREPVRVASVVIAAVLIAVASLTGVSLPVLLAQVAAAVGTLETVRKAVAPMVSVIVHADDVPEGALPVFVNLPLTYPSPADSVEAPSAPAADVESLGDDLG